MLGRSYGEIENVFSTDWEDILKNWCEWCALYPKIDGYGYNTIDEGWIVIVGWEMVFYAGEMEKMMNVVCTSLVEFASACGTI